MCDVDQGGGRDDAGRESDEQRGAQRRGYFASSERKPAQRIGLAGGEQPGGARRNKRSRQR